MSLRKLRLAVRNARGRCTDGDTDAAVRVLGAGVRRILGGRRAYQLTIDPTKVPADVRAQLDAGNAC